MSDDDRRAPPSPWDPGPPEAVITRIGPGYSIDIHQGLTGLSEPYWRPTRRWAEAKARKLLAHWDDKPKSWTVRP